MPGRDKVTPKGKDFFKQIAELEKLQVRVGFQQGTASSGGADIVDVAAWNELGTEHSPPRPFLRQSVEKYEGQIAAMCKQQLARIVKGQATAQDALQALGVMQKGLIQKEIQSGGFTPNAPITIEGGWMWRNGRAFYVKGKKSSQPLIDTGRLRQTVNFVIKAKGDD
jgi:hypothetical protein